MLSNGFKSTNATLGLLCPRELPPPSSPPTWRSERLPRVWQTDRQTGVRGHQGGHQTPSCIPKAAVYQLVQIHVQTHFFQLLDGGKESKKGSRQVEAQADKKEGCYIGREYRVRLACRLRRPASLVCLPACQPGSLRLQLPFVMSPSQSLLPPPRKNRAELTITTAYVVFLLYVYIYLHLLTAIL